MDAPEHTLSQPAIPPTKICTKCGQEKSILQFHKDRGQRRSECNTCSNARNNAFRLEHLEERRAYDRAYYAEHREERREYAGEYRKKHKAENVAYQKEWRSNHKDERAAYQRAYRPAWEKKNPKKLATKARTRRARKMQAGENRVTEEQWEFVLRHYKNKCVYCGSKKNLTQDHIVALVNGGTHTIENIVPACKSCNSRKGKRAPLIPVQPLLPFR